MDVKDYIRYYAHTYIQELLGETVYLAISFLLLLAGVVLIVIAITDSNAILGNPIYRNRSSLDDLQYKKTRQKLRITLGVIGTIMILYNISGLF